MNVSKNGQKDNESCNIFWGVSSLQIECETVNFVLYIFCSSPNKKHLEKASHCQAVISFTFAYEDATGVMPNQKHTLLEFSHCSQKHIRCSSSSSGKSLEAGGMECVLATVDP